MNNPRVVIVGAGFGGLFAARALAGKPVEVILIDKHNYHTFSPLLYQVATCALDPSEIARPVRAIFSAHTNIQAFLGEVQGIDPQEKTVTVDTEGTVHQFTYDYLILAAGSHSAYFGNDDFKPHSFELKTLENAIDLRNHALRLFERAVWVEDPQESERMLTFVVVGGGPTGLETAGALYELYNHVLDQEYKHDSLRARVVLVEMLPHLLAPYPEKLRQKAQKQLESLGVEVILENPVAKVRPGKVELADGTILLTDTLVWSVGVEGSPLGNMLGVSPARGNRIPVDRQLRVVGLENVYCIGDMSYLENPEGQPYPQMIPIAQQQAKLAAENILADAAGKPLGDFRYHDRGMMATIGRSRAVAWLYQRVQISGFLAWLAWLLLHLLSLIGFRNRLNVFVSWVWNYFTYDRSVRLILEKSDPE